MPTYKKSLLELEKAVLAAMDILIRCPAPEARRACTLLEQATAQSEEVFLGCEVIPLSCAKGGGMEDV